HAGCDEGCLDASSFHLYFPLRQELRHIQVPAVKSGNVHQPLLVYDLNRATGLRQHAEFPKVLENAVDMDHGKSRCACQVNLGQRNDDAIVTDRFTPHELFAKKMSNTLKCWPSAHVEQPFAEDACVEHCGAPQRHAELAMLPHCPLEILIVNDRG